jgi:hypothetical protein
MNRTLEKQFKAAQIGLLEAAKSPEVCDLVA